MEGLILKKLIKNSGLTQIQFAEKLGVSASAVTNWIKQIEIGEDNKELIINVMKLPTDYFKINTESVGNVTNNPIPQDEREHLWKIISTYKEIIERLEREAKGN